MQARLWGVEPTEIQATETPKPTPMPSSTPLPPATPTPTPESYTVESGDTLWEIAQRFDTTIEAIVAANPGLNPATWLSPGMLLVIPGEDSPPAVQATNDWPATARVSLQAGGIILRREPSKDAEEILPLAAYTPLTMVGRAYGKAWVKVRTSADDWGWVKLEWLDVFVDLAEVPWIFLTDMPNAALAQEAAGTAEPPPPPVSYAHISGITDYLREIYELGQGLGNRPDVFSKVGDSITVNVGFLQPFGTGRYNLGEHAYLQPVIDYHNQTWARTHTSFANLSLAAEVGWQSWKVVREGEGNAVYCRASETPLECEYRLVRPSVAVIMLGTNNVAGTLGPNYDVPMRKVIETSLERGITPVLSTIPPLDRAGGEIRVQEFNAMLASLAKEYQIPLVDYWAALQELPNWGLMDDGVHPSWAPGRENGIFDLENLRYGMPVRNLLTIQALDAVWRVAIRKP